jgi:hypothetical protein
MTRSQSTDVYKTAKANSAQDQGNAQKAFGESEGDLASYRTAMDDFTKADPFKAGGEYETAEKNITGSRASADSGALKNELALTSQRSGENSASYAPALAKATRDATLDAQTAQSQAEADRLSKETAYSAEGVQMHQFPVQAEGNLYSTSLGGSNQSLSTAGGAAASNKSFGDVFGQAFATDLADLATGKSAQKLAQKATGGDGGGPQYG